MIKSIRRGTKMRNKTLKKCPFCGGDGIVNRVPLESAEVEIYCESCEASIGWWPSLSQAKDFWNRRYPDTILSLLWNDANYLLTNMFSKPK